MLIYFFRAVNHSKTIYEEMQRYSMSGNKSSVLDSCLLQVAK